MTTNTDMIDRGYIYAGPWMYYQLEDRRWPQKDWLIWDGHAWLVLASAAGQQVLEGLRT